MKQNALSLIFLIFLITLLFSRKDNESVTTASPSPYTFSAQIRFYFNKTSQNQNCDNGQAMIESEELIREKVTLFFDMSSYRLRAPTHHHSSTTTTTTSTPLMKKNEDRSGSSNDTNNNHNNYCSLQLECIDNIPFIPWYGNALTCYQLIGLLVAMSKDEKQLAFKIVEDVDIFWHNHDIPGDHLNATKALLSLPPQETRFSQPVNFDPNRFWVCVLEDPVVLPPSSPEIQKEENELIKKRKENTNYQDNQQYSSENYYSSIVGNVTSALRIHLNADANLVNFQPEPLPRFVEEHRKTVPSSPRPDAPRYIAFRVIPNETSFNSNNNSSSSSSSSSTTTDKNRIFREDNNNKEQSTTMMNFRRIGHTIHRRLSRSHSTSAYFSKNKHNTHHRHSHYTKQQASPDDAAATSISLERTNKEDTVFSVGYACYPYNQSKNITSLTNFTATNASVDFIPLYTFPVFIQPNTIQQQDDLLNLDDDQTENSNSFLNEQLNNWWKKVIVPADLRIVPIYITLSTEYYVPTSTSSSSDLRKILFLVTVGPVELRINSSSSSRFSGNYIDTIGSCIFSWLNPPEAEDSFSRDLSFAFLGAVSVSMLGVTIVVVVWGSLEPRKTKRKKKRRHVKKIQQNDNENQLNEQLIKAASSSSGLEEQ